MENVLSKTFYYPASEAGKEALYLTSELTDARLSKMTITCLSSLRNLGVNVLKVTVSPKLVKRKVVFSELQMMAVKLAFEWLIKRHPNWGEFYVVGVSVACCAAMDVILRRPEVVRYMLISPPIGHNDFTLLTKLRTEGRIVLGSSDRLIGKAVIKRFAIASFRGNRIGNVGMVVVRQANHFLSEEANQLGAVITKTFGPWRAGLSYVQ